MHAISALFLLAVSVAASATDQPMQMRYAEPGTVERYAFSQTGWQDMSPVSEGNVIAGYIRHQLEAPEDGAQRHLLTMADVAVSYLVPSKMHIKQPADMIVDVTIPVLSRSGRAPAIDLDREAKAGTPFLAGITPSSLLVDLPMLLVPLSPKPVSPGDRWTVEFSEEFPTRIPAGHLQNPGVEDQWREHAVKATITYEFVGVTERPAGFGAQERVTAMEIRGRGSLSSESNRPGGSSEMAEEIEIEAYFDPAAGRWLEVVHDAKSTMSVRMGDREMSGNMGFTNQYRFVRTE